jgi:hypothetical protein
MTDSVFDIMAAGAMLFVTGIEELKDTLELASLISSFTKSTTTENHYQ